MGHPYLKMTFMCLWHLQGWVGWLVGWFACFFVCLFLMKMHHTKSRVSFSDKIRKMRVFGDKALKIRVTEVKVTPLTKIMIAFLKLWQIWDAWVKTFWKMLISEEKWVFAWQFVLKRSSGDVCSFLFHFIIVHIWCHKYDFLVCFSKK